MSVLGLILKHPHRAVRPYRLHDALHDPALTHGSTAMGARIVPSVKLAIDHKNPDLGVAAFEQETAALLELIDPAGTILGHGIGPDLVPDEQHLLRSTMRFFDLSGKIGPMRPERPRPIRFAHSQTPSL